MAAPEVSVVIPSGRQVRLTFALEALAAQSVGADRFEVVVVRDGDWELPPPPGGLEVRVIDAPRRSNIASMRNAGWRAARARLVAFTDDDCRPHPDWLQRLIEAAPSDDEMLQGRTEPDPDEAHLLHGLARSQHIEGPSPWHETCNMAYPRALLDRLGGFDERFAALGEDADLGLRALEGGATLRYLDDARVVHAVIPRGVGDALREARRRDTIPLLVSRHPQQRRALYGRLFWKRSHALLLLAAGAAATRRPAVAALCALPYLRANTDPRVLASPRRAVRHTGHLAVQALIDAAETAATVRAAVRERSLVL